MYKKKDLTLNELQGLIFHKTQPKQNIFCFIVQGRILQYSI